MTIARDMTIAAIEQAIREALPSETFRFKAVNADLWVRPDVIWKDDCYPIARAIAEALDHKAIDFRRDPSGSIDFDDIDEIVDDIGCETCGHGAAIVLRDVLPEAAQ